MNTDRNSKPIITGDVLTSASSKQKAPVDWMQRFKDISAIVVSLGAAVGIVGSAFTYILTEKAKRDEAQKTQLTTYMTYGGYLTLYRTDIQPMLGRLLKDKERKKLEDEAIKLRSTGTGKLETCKRIISRSSTNTGFEVFTSEEYRTYRDIHNYYESIGYALAEQQLDFEIIFNLITLPNYWNIHKPDSPWYRSSDQLTNFKSTRTYLYPDFSVMLALRSCIGDNYYGSGMSLQDFSDYVDMLGYNYLFARMRMLYRRECWHDGEMENSKMRERIHPESSSSTKLSACDILRKRLLAMKRSNNKPASWMKLYTTTQTDINPDWREKIFSKLSGRAQPKDTPTQRYSRRGNRSE